jgi:hypothetical protein
MRRAVLAAAMIFVVGCGGTLEPSTSPPTSPVSTLSAPAQSVASTAAASPVPSVTSVPGPGDLRWRQLGEVGDQIGIAGAFVFGERYVAYGTHNSGPWAWTSTAGDVWQGFQLGKVLLEPCPGSGQPYDSYLLAGATDGREIVLVGSELAAEATPCGSTRAVAWTSRDGQTWQRGQGFGGADGFTETIDVWPADGGWEALTRTGIDDPEFLWGSPDGQTWSSIGALDVPPPLLDARIRGAADGTRLMTIANLADGAEEEVFGLRGGESRLRWSRDGGTWNDVDVDFNTDQPTHLDVAVVPGPQTGDAWIVVGDHVLTEDDGADIWRSTDLVNWERGTFPLAVVWGLGWTRYGYVATGGNVGCGDGAECPPNPPQQFISRDGLSWKSLASDIGVDRFIDGPSGVLGFDGESRVWILEPR